MAQINEIGGSEIFERWTPAEPGLYRVTAYGLSTTSRENFDKYMTAKGAEGGADRAGGEGVELGRSRGQALWASTPADDRQCQRMSCAG